MTRLKEFLKSPMEIFFTRRAARRIFAARSAAAQAQCFQPRTRVDAGSDGPEPLPLVKAERTRIVLVDVKDERVRRKPPRLGEQGRGGPGPLRIGGDGDLIDIAVLRVDGDETNQPVGFVKAAKRNGAGRLERGQVAVKPDLPRLEVDLRHGLPP